MTIHHVEITNWEPPGWPWWNNVASQFEEPLIEATIKMTLSMKEYTALIGEGAHTLSVKPKVTDD